MWTKNEVYETFGWIIRDLCYICIASLLGVAAFYPILLRILNIFHHYQLYLQRNFYLLNMISLLSNKISLLSAEYSVHQGSISACQSGSTTHTAPILSRNGKKSEVIVLDVLMKNEACRGDDRHNALHAKLPCD